MVDISGCYIRFVTSYRVGGYEKTEVGRGWVQDDSRGEWIEVQVQGYQGHRGLSLNILDDSIQVLAPRPNPFRHIGYPAGGKCEVQGQS